MFGARWMIGWQNVIITGCSITQPGTDVIQRQPSQVLHAALLGLSGSSEISIPMLLAEYERRENPNVVAAWCGDYTGARAPIWIMIVPI
jgi:hypothetical protein